MSEIRDHGPFILRSILTVEPHSLECAVALASGSGRRPSGVYCRPIR